MNKTQKPKDSGTVAVVLARCPKCGNQFTLSFPKHVVKQMLQDIKIGRPIPPQIIEKIQEVHGVN